MAEKEWLLERGKLATLDVRWETEPVIRKPITGISLASGAPRLTVVGHGLTDGWRVSPYGVSGMKQINAESNPPAADDYHEVTVIDADHIELNDITPIDESGKLWPAYTSGGFIQFNTPQDLTNYEPVIDIKNKIGGTAWASSQGVSPTLEATKDNAAKKITLRMGAVDTAAIPMTTKTGVAELEMHHVSDLSDVVKLKLFAGKNEDHDLVRVTGEVTT